MDTNPNRQAASAVLMVRPAVFFSNPHTAGSNHLQQASPRDELPTALGEFDSVAETLARAGVETAIVDAPGGLPSPDAIFPNNWFSTHADGSVVLYPMLAANRRRERQAPVIEALDKRFGYTVRRTIDLSELEKAGEFVEGTGSLVLDRVHRIAYAALSPRTTMPAVSKACEVLGLRECPFIATHAGGTPIYHTNVVMSVGSDVAICCLEAIRDDPQRTHVREQLEAAGKQLIAITEAQMMGFAANVLELRGRSGPFLAISARGWSAFEPEQQRQLEARFAIDPVNIETIERVGGGGIRCMLAEIHLELR